jgi:hypothetical protein
MELVTPGKFFFFGVVGPGRRKLTGPLREGVTKIFSSLAIIL